MNDLRAQSNAARKQILGRIREALPGESTNAVRSLSATPRTRPPNGKLERQELLDLFIDRLLDYDALVLQLDNETAISHSIEQILGARGEQSLLVAEAFPSQWLPSSITIVEDMNLTTDQLAAVTTVATTCEVAIASTGTIFLVHEGAQGRRALTLLPDHHICLVRLNQVVETLGEAIAKVKPSSRKPITTISGPSATSDIEMTRIRGVHGPRRLTVILYGCLQSFIDQRSV